MADFALLNRNPSTISVVANSSTSTWKLRATGLSQSTARWVEDPTGACGGADHAFWLTGTGASGGSGNLDSDSRSYITSGDWTVLVSLLDSHGDRIFLRITMDQAPDSGELSRVVCDQGNAATCNCP